MEHHDHNMDIMVTYFTICSNLKYENTIRTTITTHYSELDYQYLRGKYFIVQNLPKTAVIKIDNHSYYSAKQCIADFLGKYYLPAY